MFIRRLSAALGLPALILALVTTSAAATTDPVAPAPGPTVVKHSLDDGMCDPIRFGTTEATASH